MKLKRSHIARILLVLAGLYAAFCGALAWAMRQPPDVFGTVMKRVPSVAFFILPFKPLWLNARAGHLQVGQPAPDFTLETYDKKTRIKLSSFQGQRPVVLVFGSYT